VCSGFWWPWLAFGFGLRLEVGEVLVEGLAVTFEALPPSERRFLRPGFGGLAAAGELGAGLRPILTASGGLGGPVLVPGVVGSQGCLLRSEEISQGVQGVRRCLDAVALGLDGCLPLACFGLGCVLQFGGYVFRACGVGSAGLEFLGLQLASSRC
jgi:hypothetical protein